MDGEKVISMHFSINKTVVEISDLRKGAYLLKIEVNESIFHQKLIIQ
jgi:hypothetical protein